MSKPKTVLIADGNPEFRAGLVKALRQEKELEVLGDTGDGQEAVTLCASLHPDLLIMDMILSQLDGVEVLTTLNTLTKKPSVLVTSTFTSSRLAEFVASHGANYFMAKPCSLSSVTRRALQMLASTPPEGKAAQPLETTVTAILHELGVPAHLDGYRYLRSAILSVVDNKNLVHGMMKTLYPSVAKRFGTTVSCVERSMRNAIEQAFGRNDPDVLRFYFGSSIQAFKGKPTNREFISLLSDRLRTDRLLEKLPQIC